MSWFTLFNFFGSRPLAEAQVQRYPSQIPSTVAPGFDWEAILRDLKLAVPIVALGGIAVGSAVLALTASDQAH